MNAEAIDTSASVREQDRALELERQQLAAARAMVRDLFQPDARIYWADFLLHTAVGWSALIACAVLAMPLWLLLICWLLAVLALYRAVIFIHELAHLRPGALPGFRLGWNLLCGIPMLAPSFTYSGVHNHHHKRDVYGTAGDGEYLAFARFPHWLLIGHLLLGVLVPALVLLRFVVVTPLSLMLPPLRRWSFRSASSLTVDFRYQREVSERDDKHWQWQEIGAWLWGSSMLLLMVNQVLPWSLLFSWYAVLSGIMLTNGVRTLIAHRYRHDRSSELSLMQQFHDSVDVSGHRYLTSLWAPVGLRYHATHHLFPSMPYHNLGTAHRRLRQATEIQSWYMQAHEPNLRRAWSRLWQARGELLPRSID
jgi:fatty acid desaturase